ncbi:TrbC/VirB2 family protein, partial [Anaplasma bovis]
SSIMAIFGKVSWPAIVMLVVFTGIFFGAGKIMQKFAHGLNGNIAVNNGRGSNVESWTCQSSA